jgi:O-acetyl-ADP-ribose deacetylase
MNQTHKAYTFPSGQLLQIVQGDITSETVDAIVNAANKYLEHGAGVAGAIVRRGGLVIQVESSQWVRDHGLVSHAEPAYTSGGNLPCRFVIHAVGPRWGEGQEEEKLAASITGSLQLADQLGLTSIAFPAISTGTFDFPKERAAQVILATIQDFIERASNSCLKNIRLVLFDQEILQVFLNAWEHDDHFRS